MTIGRNGSAVLFWLGLASLAACAEPALAQDWLATPATLAGGRIVLAGDASVTFGSGDEGFFNYTNYESSTLRRIRAGLAARVVAGSRLSLLAELRAETGSHVEAYAWYARMQPWPDRSFVVQAGRIPPVFGSYGRRAYPQDNPLIGDPLAYQYLTSIRYDAVPASADELLRMRGRGWLASYSVGNPKPAPGLPVVSALRWDTGIQARVGWRAVEASAAWTIGSLSHPLVKPEHGTGQVSGRMAITPVVGLAIGVSAARGPYLSKEVLDARPAAGGGPSLRQRSLGTDLEFSRGHWLVRGEAIVNSWSVPALSAPRIEAPLGMTAAFIEGRYRLRPGFYLAGRLDRLAFEKISGSAGPVPWEAGVSRFELASGYSLTRHLMVKACYQYNQRDGGRIRRNHLAGAQWLFWF